MPEEDQDGLTTDEIAAFKSHSTVKTSNLTNVDVILRLDMNIDEDDSDDSDDSDDEDVLG